MCRRGRMMGSNTWWELAGCPEDKALEIEGICAGVGYVEPSLLWSIIQNMTPPPWAPPKGTLAYAQWELGRKVRRLKEDVRWYLWEEPLLRLKRRLWGHGE